MKVAVIIARALAVDPELILADEPISMLDVSIRMGILNVIEQLKEERGIAYLYITHDLASARYIGDKIMVMYAGHMVEGGDGEEIMSNPAHPYTQLLLSAVPDPQVGLRIRWDTGTRGSSLTDRPTARLSVRGALHEGHGHLPTSHAGPDEYQTEPLGPLSPVWNGQRKSWHRSDFERFGNSSADKLAAENEAPAPI